MSKESEQNLTKRFFVVMLAFLQLAAVLSIGAFAAEAQAQELKITSSPLNALSWDGVTLRIYRPQMLKSGTTVTLTPTETG